MSDLFFHTVLTLSWIGALLYVGIQVCLALAWRSVPKTPPPHEIDPPISVIIACRNELLNLKQHLSSWIAQDYPNYELVLVLDRCEDGSAAWIRQHFQGEEKIVLVELDQCPETWSGKKWALQQGIEHAQHEWMAFTDADCYTPPSWLPTLSRYLRSETDLILGIGRYQKSPGLLNDLIQFETFYTCFQYVGFSRLGLPYMAVGRNLAYRKSFFYAYDGFERFKGQVSGDDDLLVNAFAHPSRVSIMLEKEGYTHSVAPRSWLSWFYQKTRHVSASKHYSVRSKAVLGLFHVSHLCFYVGLFVTMTLLFVPNQVLGLIALKWLGGIASLSLIRKQFTTQRFIRFYPWYDFFVFVYNVILVPMGLILKPEWKKNLKHPKIPRKIASW